jgi:hypothetical protein
MSTPAIDVACATLRSFVHLSGALRAQALVPRGDGKAPAIVSCERLGPLEIEIEGHVEELTHDARFAASPPDLGQLQPMPPFEVVPERGEVTGMIGGVDLLAEAVQRAAAAIGPEAVVVVEMESTTPGVPFALSARVGEPVLVTLGDEEFEL